MQEVINLNDSELENNRISHLIRKQVYRVGFLKQLFALININVNVLSENV